MLKRRPPEGNVRRVTSIELNSRGVMTNKAGRLVQFESFAEFLLTLQLERIPAVIDYGSQPETFEFFDSENMQKRTYTPDFVVWKKDGKIEIHEVTRSERQNKLSVKMREEAAARICYQRNWSYVVHNEQTLPNGTEKANLLFLFSYRPSSYYNQAIASEITELVSLQCKEPVMMQVVADKIAIKLGLQTAIVLATTYHLIWHQQLACDLNKLLINEGLPAIDSYIWSV